MDNDRSDPCASVKALGIGALGALLIGMPVAALLWFLIGVQSGARTDLAFFGAYFVLVWGWHFTWPGDLILGGLGGLIALALARRTHGEQFIVSVALCGALLGALNGAWLIGAPKDAWPFLYIALGAGAGAVTGVIAGLIIRRFAEPTVLV